MVVPRLTCMTMFREIGDRRGEAEVLNSLGALATGTGEPAEGLALHRAAHELAVGIRSLPERARAREGMADCAARAGDRTGAVAGLREAVALYRDIGAAEAVLAGTRLAALEREAL